MMIKVTVIMLPSTNLLSILVFNLLLSTSLQLLPALLQQLNSHRYTSCIPVAAVNMITCSKLKKRLKLTVKLFATDLLQVSKANIKLQYYY